MRAVSGSAEETGRMARELVERLRPLRNGAVVVALSGELGAGKTLFVQAMLRALGWKGRVPSPTFVIMRRYALRGGVFARAYHIDAYRVRDAREEARRLGLKDIFADTEALVLIEWPERLRGVLPKKVFRIQIAHGRQEHERTLRFKI